MAQTNPYNYQLPTIDFGVAGTTDIFRFYLKTSTGAAFNANGGHVYLSFINYNNPYGTPILSEELTLEQDDDDIYSIAVYTPEASDTINLDGLYIYQITVIDAGGKVEAKKGKAYITNNIDKAILST
jgi:hypothetical protein